MLTKLLSSVALAAIALNMAGPAMAQNYYNRHDDHRNDHRYDPRFDKNYQKDLRKHQKEVRKAYRARVRDWKDDREDYRRNWNRMNEMQRRQFDAQMRNQWRLYKGNNYNGAYNWNMYNDPNFMDYLHNNNPSLMTSIRNALGF